MARTTRGIASSNGCLTRQIRLQTAPSSAPGNGSAKWRGTVQVDTMSKRIAMAPGIGAISCQLLATANACDMM